GSTAFAQSDPDRQSSDEVGAQAVKSLGKVPWYDSEEERVKAVKVESTDGAKADLPTRAAGYQGKAGTRPLGGGSFWAGVGEVLTWSILSVIVLLVVAGIAYALLRLERNRIARQVGEGDMESEQTESA